MTKELKEKYVFGYAELAQVLSTTPEALRMRNYRGVLNISPLFHIGRVAVFDREAAEALSAKA